MNLYAYQQAREAGEIFVHYPLAGRKKQLPLRVGQVVENDDTLSANEFGFAIAGLEAAVTRESGGFATIYVLYPVEAPAICNLWIGPLDVLSEYVVEVSDEVIQS
jgi:hypothetical protein